MEKFIADVHLGKLARLLRMLGFDTIYQNNFTFDELLKIGREQNRILLSRKASLSKIHTVKQFLIAGEDPSAQLQQVIQHFNLKNEVQPFSRCMVCNGILEKVLKENINHLIEKNTKIYFDEFWQCQKCKRIYWKGSHFERINATIQTITS